MAQPKSRPSANARKQKLREAMDILTSLQFGSRQRNEIAGYTFLSLLGLKPQDKWESASNPLCGITPIIDFIAEQYNQRYAPNTRETIRDEAVKYFVEAGMLVRNPDDPHRPTNSMNTVYQVEAAALALFKTYGTLEWSPSLRVYLSKRQTIQSELQRARQLALIPVTLPGGEVVLLSPGGQNPLIKNIIEEFCPRYTPGGVIVYVGDTKNKFEHLHADYLANLGVVIDPAAKMPDVVVHDTRRNWLLLIEAVVSTGAVDYKRRNELKALFRCSKAGLVFVTAFENRQVFGRFQNQISWETEVWVADAPDHIIHFNGERFLGPYPDVTPPELSRPNGG